MRVKEKKKVDFQHFLPGAGIIARIFTVREFMVPGVVKTAIKRGRRSFDTFLYPSAGYWLVFRGNTYSGWMGYRYRLLQAVWIFQLFEQVTQKNEAASMFDKLIGHRLLTLEKKNRSLQFPLNRENRRELIPTSGGSFSFWKKKKRKKLGNLNTKRAYCSTFFFRLSRFFYRGDLRYDTHAFYFFFCRDAVRTFASLFFFFLFEILKKLSRLINYYSGRGRKFVFTVKIRAVNFLTTIFWQILRPLLFFKAYRGG